jgi:hypothetical protein
MARRVATIVRIAFLPGEMLRNGATFLATAGVVRFDSLFKSGCKCIEALQ